MKRLIKLRTLSPFGRGQVAWDSPWRGEGALACVLLVAFAWPAQADIYQWEYIDPADPSQGKRQSTTLAPDGAGVDAGPGADLSTRDLTMAYLIGTDLTSAIARRANLTDADLSQANLTNASFGGGPNGPGATLAGANFSDADLRGANFNGAILTDADFAGAEVRGAKFSIVCGFLCRPGTGITLAQLYSTASYQAQDLSGIYLFWNDLTGGTFSRQNLTSASFSLTVLTGADFSQANLFNATFDGADLTNANFRQADLTNASLSDQNSSISFGPILTNADFRQANLTNANFFNATLTEANLTAADARGAFLNLIPSAIATNLIHPDGHVDGLDLAGAGLLFVRDYDGNSSLGNGPIPITVDQHFVMTTGGTLQMVFEADAWDSTISFAPGIPVALGGTLELAFAPEVNLASQLGCTLKIFDWTGVDPTGTFAVTSPYRWDLSNLYTTGEITLAAVPEPSSIVVLASVLLLAVGYRGRDRWPRSQFALLLCAALVEISSAGGQRAVAGTVTVMTQNLYQGFDAEKFLADVSANPQNVVALTTAAYAQVLANDFAIRADAVALAVDQHRPALIGLQEVSLYRTAPFDGPGPPHATNVEIDYLETLLDALSARGLSYAAVASVQNTDAEFPRLVGFDASNNPILQDIRLTDRDVILARTDLTPSQLEVSNPQSGNYSADFSALGITFRNGWTAVDVESLGTEFRFVSTHLARSPAAIQELQAAELVPGAANTSLPTILMGDFNSRADGTGSASYANLIAAGFSDAWSAIHPDDPGYTCCQAANLLNAPSQLSERIDLALFRNGPVALDALVVGAALTDRTPAGLWPSDHAGIVATLNIVPEPGTIVFLILALPALFNTRRFIPLRSSLLQLAAISCFLGITTAAHGDIYQWEYINPNDPSQGKQQSMTLAPDGAGVDFVRGADLSGRNLTMAYLIGADLFTGAPSLFGADLAGTNLSRADLTNAILAGANLTGTDFSDADVLGASFDKKSLVCGDVCISPFPPGHVFYFGTGIALPQLYSTASYQARDLSGIDFTKNELAGGNFAGQNLTNTSFYRATLTDADFREATLSNTWFYLANLTGANFAGQNLTNKNFDGAWLTDADFTGAEVRGATFESDLFGGSGISPTQLYSTASYQAHDLSGIDLLGNYLVGAYFVGQNLSNATFGTIIVGDLTVIDTDLTGANFSHANLTNTMFKRALVSGADFTGADARNSYGLDRSSATTTNMILPNGHIDGLNLDVDELLLVRDYRYFDGNPMPFLITIDQHLAIGPGGTLRMVFEADAWDSTISFAPGIPVTLGGTLELTFADDVNLASQLGRTFDLFNWTGVNPTGAFAISSPYTWDVSALYTTGEVTLTAVPEPSSQFLCVLAAAGAFCTAVCRRTRIVQEYFWITAFVAALYFVPGAKAAAVRTVVLSGQPAAGTPAGVTYSSFGAHYLFEYPDEIFRGPVINDAGRVAFRADLAGTGISSANNQGIWSEGSGIKSLVARTDGDAPGAPDGVQFARNPALQLFEPVINSAGQTAFYGGLADGTVGVWSEGTGSLELVARDGMQVAGAPDDVFHSFGVLRDIYPDLPKLNNAGQTAFWANLAGSNVNNTNDWGVWSDSGGSLGLVARAGNPAPGTSDGVNFDSFFFQTGFNDTGQTAFYAYVTGSGVDFTNDHGIWSDGIDGPALVARSGMPAPGLASGVTFRDLWIVPAINNSGSVAFGAFLTGNGVDETNDQSFWSNASGALSLLARGGTPAPGTPSGVNFSTFNYAFPVLNDAGQAAFRGELTGSGVNSTNNRGIWIGVANDVNLAVRTGDPAPGTASGVRFSDLSRPALNDAGQIALRANLTGTGVNSSNDLGIWATDQAGVLQLIARKGAQLEVTPGVFRTISDLGFTADSGNSDGRASGFNDLGQLVFWARFTNGTQGVFVSNLVASVQPLLGDYNKNGIVDAADYTVWRNHLGTNFDLHFNGDEAGASAGVVDDADYALWKAHFGETVGSGSAGVSPSHVAVPEPAGILLAAIALSGAILRRRRHASAVLNVAVGATLWLTPFLLAHSSTIEFDATQKSPAVIPFDPDASFEARNLYVSGRVPTSVKGPVRGGTNINTLLGADAFYNQGYTGTSAVIANIESGHIWSGHETLTHVLQIPNHPQSLNEIDRHATWVASVLGGRQGGANPGAYQEGMAPDAQLYSGAIGRQFEGPRYALGAANFNHAVTYDQYRRAFSTGVNAAGRTSDVINSSWGFGSGANGSDNLTIAFDGFVNSNPRTLFVAAAGNEGPGPDTVRSPGAAYNTLCVAALGPNPPYNKPGSFSSGGPNDYVDPVNGTKNDARQVVDIAAPGENLAAAYYGGETGGNGTTDNPTAPGPGPTGLPYGPLGGPDYYTRGAVYGTSLAAPAVAGGAALLYDAAYDVFADNPDARDARVMKAVLMNSADKTVSWNNGQITHPNGNGGVITTQGLDNRVGTGRMNLAGAYEQFLTGITDVAGMNSGDLGLVHDRGWDFGQVVSGTTNDYFFDSPLEAGTTFTATLTWFRDRRINDSNTAFDDSFDDLNLELWNVVDAAPVSLISESSSLYNESEHFSFAVPATGEYALRVRWFKEVFDRVADANQELYGLAWSAGAGLGSLAVPEPATFALAAFGLLGLVVCVRRPQPNRGTGGHGVRGEVLPQIFADGHRYRPNKVPKHPRSSVSSVAKCDPPSSAVSVTSCFPRTVPTMRTILSITAAAFVFTNAACADIYQWEYINPADSSQGKQQSTTLAPDGAGVDAVPGADLSERDLTMAYLVGADLMNANGSLANLDDAELSQSNLIKARFGGAGLIGADLSYADLTDAYFGPTSFACGDFDICTAPGATLTGISFANANVRRAIFRGAILTDADFTSANVQGADFSKWSSILLYGTGITLLQLYSTASYEAHDLSGIHFGRNNLSDGRFVGQNLTNADFYLATLMNVDFTAADTRGARYGDRYFDVPAGAITVNLIRPDGHLGGLELALGQLLSVRDYDGNPMNFVGNPVPPIPIPIAIDEHLTIDSGGTLRMVFEADAWDSTISFAPGIPVTLGGTLELTFATDVNLASQVGRTFDLFDWTGVAPIGTFAVSSPHHWDLSNLYTTGEVTLTAVPEPTTLVVLYTMMIATLFRYSRVTR